MATNTRKLAALLGAGGAGIADAGTINTAGITADAIDNTKIADNAVNADSIAANAVGTSEVADNVLTATDLAANSVGESELSVDYTAQSVPHIVPNMLHPAIGGKGIDGTTTVSSFGTDVTINGDTRQYYYTDIKGSKPIKDPRIGGHFGSQRYKLKSLQLLEQETATHGKGVKCADGREWIRFVDGNWSWHTDYDGNGHYIAAYTDCTNNLFEITGYFNDINFLIITDPSRATNIDVSVNGTLMVDNSTTLGGVTSVANPLHSRYVDAGSMINGGSLTANGAGQSGTLASNLGTTPKINTVKFEITSGSSKTFYISAIELIAQDTSSDARRSEIKIPKQNVVSFGKKFEVGSDDLDNAIHPHYDPFNGFTSGNLAAVQALGIDTATSLGLSKWLPSDAGTTYYKPFNGGRVVKWVDSSGVIKTSVNMMPPNAKSIANSASPTNAFATRTTASHFGTNNPMNSFEAGTDLDSDQLSEVAKAFHFREFGNGSANGGTGSGSYADWSMLTASNDNIAYVMDDGLTSLTGNTAYAEVNSGNGEIHYPGQNNYYSYLTFIGTGISIKAEKELNKDVEHIAENLPYGTHIVKFQRDSSNSKYVVDGVDLGTISNSGVGGYTELLLKQPKKPPIPEDCVVLADYMLMADYVEMSSITDTNFEGKISKGVRRVSGTRDVFVNASSSTGMGNVAQGDIATMGPWGMYSFYSPSGSVDATVKLPFFGSKFFTWAEGTTGYASSSHYAQSINSTSLTITAQNQANGTSSPQHLDGLTNNSSVALGNNVINHTQCRGQFRFVGFDLQTPIHSSSHYQPFETPFLHELVGGDRNMEQTNLVCSPDGKSWDEITRDVSYMGQEMTKPACTSSNDSSSAKLIFDKQRGQNEGSDLTLKNFACGYDRFICLRDGMYEIMASTMKNINTTYHVNIWVNETRRKAGHSTNINHDTITNILTTHLKRGDYVRLEGGWYGSAAYSHFHIIRLEK